MQSALYPDSKGGIKSRYVGGILKFYTAAGVYFYGLDGPNAKVLFPAGTKISAVNTNPSAAFNLSVFSQSAANTYSGTLTSVLGAITLSGTVDIGNAWAGYFLLTQSAKPTSQGHTSALYVGVTVAVAGNNPTSVMTMELGGADGGTSTPFIMFQNSNAAKTTVVLDFGPAGALLGTAGSGSNAVAFGTGAVIAAGDLTAGLRIKVNGAIYHIPLVATAAFDGS